MGGGGGVAGAAGGTAVVCNPPPTLLILLPAASRPLVNTALRYGHAIAASRQMSTCKGVEDFTELL